MLKDNSSSNTPREYEIIDVQIPYAGFFRLAKYTFRMRLFNGSMSQPISREVLERKSAVGILPYDPVQDKVLLIEQFRIGAIQHFTSPWMWEIVAGVIDEKENLLDVAKRESLEEANCEITEFLSIYDYLATPGGCNEMLSLYIGCFDATNTIPGVFGLEEENEDIRTNIMSLDAALNLLNQGKINTSPAIIALQWLQINREQLKTLWQAKVKTPK